MACPIAGLSHFRRSLALLALLLLPALANAQGDRSPKPAASWQSWRNERMNALAQFPKAPAKPGKIRAERLIGPVLDVAASYGPLNTTTTGSLTDMSSGTTLLVGPDQDDTPSSVRPIGFDFYFQGVRFDLFSVNSNGLLALGAIQVIGATYDPLAQADTSLITAYGADQRTAAVTGKVHSKVIGTAPNRVLVVEWLDMQSSWPEGGTPDLTYQVRLSETSGAIEFVYGSMRMTAAGVASTTSRSPQIGFSSSNTIGTVGTITAAQSGSPAPTFSGASEFPVDNEYVEGPITVLDSAADGARRTFLLASPVPNPANGPLTFTSVTLGGMTLNWADSSNELAYAIYNSTDGTNFSYVGSAAANATSYAATGLVGTTTYQWRVHAVSEGALSTPLTGTQATSSPTPNISVASGNWDAATTWSAGVPTNQHSVTIAAGTTVTINTPTCVAFSTVVAGTLQYHQTTASTLTVTSDVTVQSGGTFQSNPAGNQTAHSLSLGGSLTNNGALDFSTNSNTAGAGITFTGSTNATFGGTGATTDVRTINVNKGTARTPLLELIPSAFTVRGVTTDTVTGGWLIMNNGTIRVGGTFAGASRVFSTAGYSIPANFGFWLDNPNYTVTGQAANNTHSGLLRVSQGTFAQGTTAAHRMRGNDGAVFTIEGGTVNCSGQFSPEGGITYNQSGGTFNVALVGNTQATRASFELFFRQDTVFNMTGGTIVIHQRAANANPIDYLVVCNFQAATGTVQLGSAATPSNTTFRVAGDLPSLVINNVASGTVANILARPYSGGPNLGFVSTYGSTNIKAGTTMTLTGPIIARGSPFTNDGTLTGIVTGPGTISRLFFYGDTAPSVYTGGGVVTAPLTSLEVDNPAGLAIAPTVNQITALQLIMYAGGVTGTGKLTLGNGGTTTAVLQLGVNGVFRPVTGVDVTPVYNPGTGGISLIYDQELTPRTTGPELPADRTVTSLFFRNDTTIAGGDVTVTSLLDLTAAIVTTGPNTLSLVGGAAVIRNDTGFGYVTGNLRKSIPGAGSGTVRFEVGDQVDGSSGYGPLEFVVNSGVFPASVTVSTTPGRPAYADPFLNALQRSWKITTDNPLNANLTFNYQAFEAISTYEGYLFLRLQNGVYSSFTPSFTPMATSSVLNGASITGVSEWTMVEPTAPAFLNLDTTVFVVGQSNTFTFSVVGAPDPSLSVDPMSDPLPDGVTFNPATGVLSGTPATGTNGHYLLIVTAANGTFDMQQYFHLYVSDTANQNPVANADIMGTRAGVPATVPAIRLMINDTDPDGDTLSISGVSSTSTQGGSITHCGCFQYVTYYPPPGFSGTDSFTYTLSDGRGGTATGTVTVTVNPGNTSQNITGLTTPGGVPTLTAYGIPGRTYRLEYADDLMTGSWSTLTSAVAGTNGAFVLTDPSEPLPPSRFYRVVEDF